VALVEFGFEQKSAGCRDSLTEKGPDGRGTIAFFVWQIRDSEPIARLNALFEAVHDCHDS